MVFLIVWFCFSVAVDVYLFHKNASSTVHGFAAGTQN
jgi:hypothetical protein